MLVALLKYVHNSYHHLDGRLFTAFNFLVFLFFLFFLFIECVHRITRELNASPKQETRRGRGWGLRLRSQFPSRAMKNRETVNSLPWFSFWHHSVSYLQFPTNRRTNNNNKSMIYNIFNSSVPSLVFYQPCRISMSMSKGTNIYCWFIKLNATYLSVICLAMLG